MAQRYGGRPSSKLGVQQAASFRLTIHFLDATLRHHKQVEQLMEIKTWIIALVIFVVSGLLGATVYNVFFPDPGAAGVPYEAPVEDAVEETVDE